MPTLKQREVIKVKPRKGTITLRGKKLKIVSGTECFIIQFINSYKLRKTYSSLDKAGIKNGDDVSFFSKGTSILAVGSPQTNCWVDLRSGAFSAFSELKLPH